jgi:hypothetical protein
MSMSADDLYSVSEVAKNQLTVLSVDLRDAVGDRLFLSERFTRDGVRRYPSA